MKIPSFVLYRLSSITHKTESTCHSTLPLIQFPQFDFRERADSGWQTSGVCHNFTPINFISVPEFPLLSNNDIPDRILLLHFCPSFQTSQRFRLQDEFFYRMLRHHQHNLRWKSHWVYVMDFSLLTSALRVYHLTIIYHEPRQIHVYAHRHKTIKVRTKPTPHNNGYYFYNLSINIHLFVK